MADKAIGELPKAPQINDDSLLVVEQQGMAMKMSGRQFREFAEAGGRSVVSSYVEPAIEAANKAELAKEQTAKDAEDAKNAAQNAVKSATESKESELLAKESEDSAKTSEGESKRWAGLSQSYAEQASVPAVQGVYNVILTDRATGEKYALIVENGRPYILGVSDSFEATEMVFVDIATGASIQLGVENGRLFTEEV